MAGSPPTSPASPLILPRPELEVRWVHAGSQYLDLLPVPITSTSTIYKPFSPDESRRIEERWVSMSEEEQGRAVEEWGKTEGEGVVAIKEKEKEKERDKDKEKQKQKQRRASVISNASNPEKGDVLRSGEEQPHDEKDGEGRYRDIMLQAQKDYENMELISGVPVSQDSLFEVSLPTLSLHPTFWSHTGPRVSVLRGTWFVTDERPCSWDLAAELEKGYDEIKPWQPSYKDELAAAMALGPAAEDKLKHVLPARFGHLGVIFEDADRARLLTSGAFDYLPRAFLALKSRPTGTYVYRGYTAACTATSKTSRSGSTSASHSRRPSSSTPRNVKVDKGVKVEDLPNPLEDVKAAVKEGLEKATPGDRRKALEEEATPVVDSEEDDTPCTDLILVIHGIGQQLAMQYESFNFVYAGNQLRQILRKQTTNPAISSIMRNRRVQVLPVQWRAMLVHDQESSEEDQQHNMDNRFSMSDITMNKSIPYVRELTNSVLLDIPLFMSDHRKKMIEAVCVQANKLYRLWIARNPDFEKNGRVHIIGHSLGSALAAHILSNQPTKMPPLSQLPRQVITQTRDRFLFNTSDLFLCGSPLGIFLYLEQAQLMPRKGRERTMNSPQDEALDRSGKFGCLSIDSLYNVFYPTDPVAYTLNAAVDSRIAATRQPLPITSVTAPFYATVTDSFGSISRYLPPLPSFVSSADSGDKKPTRPNAIRLPSGIEMSGPSGEERLEGSRGERRFSALNPHGNIDFFLPAAGVSEYLDMITAHASYWSDPSFAAFLLAEIYSTRLDMVRTGMGLAQSLLPEGTTI